MIERSKDARRTVTNLGEVMLKMFSDINVRDIFVYEDSAHKHGWHYEEWLYIVDKQQIASPASHENSLKKTWN